MHVINKQSWRILRSPESLLFKVLRGRYFRTGDFLKAPAGNNSSLTLRSTVWGRDLFKEGYKWRVGNGDHICIDEEPWLGSQGNRYPCVVAEEPRGRRVSSLIKSNGQWDEDLIKRSFCPMDADDILDIPIGNPLQKMKSFGPWILRECLSQWSSLFEGWRAKSFSRVEEQKVWGRIWSLNILPRAKLCLWNIIKNIIPTKRNLILRGLDINLVCSLCRKKGKIWRTQCGSARR